MRTWLPYSAAGALLVSIGCSSTPKSSDVKDQREVLELLMPTRIEIVEPFTRIASFDDDVTPDGVELYLQATNSLERNGLTIAGHIRVELFKYVKASANNEGERLDYWEIPLTSVDHQQTYWNSLTQMYEFRLGIANKPNTTSAKYVITATYFSPFGERLRDDFVISYTGKTGRGSTRRP